MAANPGKLQFMFLGLKEKPTFILEINDKVIPLTDKAKLLGVSIDSQLKFDDQVKALCQKANRKLNAFSRVAPYLTTRMVRSSIIHLLCLNVTWEDIKQSGRPCPKESFKNFA